MPLAKKYKGHKNSLENQGAKWDGVPGNEGNIKNSSKSPGGKGSRNVSRKGRDLSIGRHKGTHRKDVNPE